MRLKLGWGRNALVALGTVALGLGGAAVSGVGPAAATTPGASNFAVTPSATTVFQGENGQAGANVTFDLLNDFSSSNTVTLDVAPNGASGGANNCTTSTSTVVFAAAPTVVATPVAGTTTPTFSVTLGENSADTSCTSITDQVIITLTDTASGTSTDTIPVTISDISYDVGSTAATGLVELSGAWTVVPTQTTAASIGVSDAKVAIKGSATVSANNPSVTITEGTSGGAPSPIVVTETAAGAVADSICITPSSSEVPFTFASAGNAVSSTGTGTGTIGTPAISGDSIIATVTASTTTATTYTFSGFTVDDSDDTGPATVTVTSGGANCGAEDTSLSQATTVFGSAPDVPTAIAGADTDGTAIAELEEAYPVGSGCVTGGKVILATDQNFPDALAASYLAGNLGTGILLTPTDSLSTETQEAFQTEGVTDVYVVGGPLAVSQNVISQVEALPAYECGGTTKTGSDIVVTGPIYGQTQYDTAEDIATYTGQAIGTSDLSAAYTGTYNDTTGNESSTPSATGALRTAIITSGENFPDATAGSIIAYREHFPVLLTTPSALSTQASQALTALGIQQVIVLGGPLAISDDDVTAIQNLGISVIRVAGQDQTDTAQELAQFELNQSATFTGLGWGATSGPNQWGRQILLARGDFYADALAGSVLGNLGAYPILLTENPTTVGQYLTTFLETGGSAAGIDGLNSVSGYNGNIQTIQPLGGPLALQYSTLSAAAAAVAAG